MYFDKDVVKIEDLIKQPSGILLTSQRKMTGKKKH